MGPKVEDLQKATTGEKDTDESSGVAHAAPAESAATGSLLDESSGSNNDHDESIADRRLVSAHRNLQHEGFFWSAMRIIFYIPLKIMSIFGYNILQPSIHVSGNDSIDKSPLRPASTSPQKRKRDEILETSSVEDEDDVAKLLDDEDYNSEEDEEFKPGDESTCSEEFTEGDTEAELSKLSVEDVSEPRPSALRNLVEVDLNDKDKKKIEEKTKIPAKCVDEPISKPEVTPATVGVMG